jgi:S-(hydroxymethyl)glutathione dehydrogenase / alcohol dehydrogenase
VIRAAVSRSFGQDPEIEAIDLDDPGPGEVRVRMRAVAICHSDVAAISGAWGGDLPAVYGHEAAGTVVEIGEGVTGLFPGDQVVVGLVRSCGRCRRCQAGEPTLCEVRFRLDEQSPIRLAAGGRASQGMRVGAFADELVVDASQAVPIPADIPPASASVIACAVLTGLGAVERTAGVRSGESVVVIGAGGVGVNAIQGAALAGADPVIAIDVARPRLIEARAFGATHGVDSSIEDPIEAVRDLAAGGADHVLVTVGVPAATVSGLEMLRRGGTLTLVGMPPTGALVGIDACEVAHDAKRILGCKLGSARPAEDVPAIIDRYRDGKLRLDELVTSTYPLDAIGEALAETRAGRGLRTVLVP